MMAAKSFLGITQQDLLTAQELGRGDLSRYLIALAAVRKGFTVGFETFVSSESKSFFGTAPNYNGRYLSVSDGKRTVYFDGSRGQDTLAQVNNLAAKKDESGIIFNAKGVRTPKSIVIFASELEKIKAFLKASRSERFILKPASGSLGQGVEINLLPSDVLEIVTKKRNKWILQEMIHGPEYRIYVSNKKAIASFKKLVPSVTGDGRKSIRELVKNKNEDIALGGIPKNQINLEQSEIFLRSTGRSLEYKPRFLEVVELSDKNFVPGFDTEDVTNTISEELKSEAIKATIAIGIPNAGVDVLLCTERNLAYVLEVNPRANIQLHTFPSLGNGQGLKVPESILDYYFRTESKKAVYPNFPIDFCEVKKALGTGLFRRVEIISPKPEWILRQIHLENSIDSAMKVEKMLKMVCIFVNWYKRCEGDNKFDVYFLDRGYRSFIRSSRKHTVPIISKEVDKQVLHE
ncbi:hypothetical protein [Nioella sp.]|uniref:hypothetical protein n=1 Tax=Nioella sp. TaxID=1912091 RepID=UPI003B51B9DA